MQFVYAEWNTNNLGAPKDIFLLGSNEGILADEFLAGTQVLTRRWAALRRMVTTAEGDAVPDAALSAA